MQHWTGWLEATRVATLVRDGRWLFPAIETLHIIGFAIVTGAAFVFDLRLLGFSQSISITALARHVLPWARRSFVVLVLPTGVLLFAVQATELAASGAFRLKLFLIALAVLNTFLFHGRTAKTIDAWDRDAMPPVAARLAGASSLVLWIGAITCGRWLAYF